MKNEEFIENFFEEMDINDAFDMEDDKLEKYSDNMTNSSAKLYKYIKSNLNPEEQKKIQTLLSRRNLDICAFFHRENFLYYKNGLTSGIYFILSLLHHMQ